MILLTLIFITIYILGLVSCFKVAIVACLKDSHRCKLLYYFLSISAFAFVLVGILAFYQIAAEVGVL